ncbi:putative enzyme [uncultured Desulfobacterium sp.]|uniref:Metallo-beta-lactamase domain-containing protein 1 n=1 Tax=uncultured Desulfobacterium sp. TaxID=201089 RepID=A0A445N180_9BACT|nr:putative enzyme [uncultured Desulfobacterium sp.]
MAEIKVLITGHHSKDSEKRPYIGSTVTLIKGQSNIIVDTGSFLDKDKLIKELKNEGLRPEDISAVIITHLDLDHIVNTYLFKNAKVFCKFRGGEYPGQTHFPSEGRLQRTNLLKKDLVDKDVEIILTPGHAEDLISVIVNTAEGKVVIAGDAIPSKEWTDFKRQPSPLITDIEKFNHSRRRIVEVADYIVPGHGEMFKVKKSNL